MFKMPLTRNRSRSSRGRLIVKVERDSRCETDKSGSVSKRKNTSGKSVKNKKTTNVQKKNGQKTVNKPVKTSVKNIESVSKESTPVKLRARRNVKYVESSLDESTQKEATSAKKVPIYKQHINEKKPRKRKDDYEFDSDTENQKKQKRRNENVSDLNDTSLENFLNKAVKKNKHPSSSKQRKAPRPRNTKKDEFVIDEVCFDPKTRKFVNKIHKCVINSQKTSTPLKEVSVAVPKKNDNKRILDFESSDDLVHKTPKIKILSNLSLTPRDELYITSPSFKNVPPNANSTMINNKVLTPWRFNDINIRRNPHFISYKQSSLPHINQEMVLDHTIVDKLNETSKTVNSCHTKTQNTPTSKLKQCTLNDYFDSNKENQENVSLFDIDQFSPVKTRNKTENVTDNVRRRILGEKNENVSSSTQPVSVMAKSPVKDKKNEVHNNFGFDSDDDEVENEPIQNKCNKPFRVSVNVNDKKYQCKKKVYFKKAESVAESDEESNLNDVDDLEDENAQYKLFEDFDSTNKHLEVKRKRKFDGDYRDLQRLKKRKDVRTKEEEAEAEKWAAAFNSMCEEVEQFPLEIE